jgi:hypothetical protein
MGPLCPRTANFELVIKPQYAHAPGIMNRRAVITLPGGATAACPLNS